MRRAEKADVDKVAFEAEEHLEVLKAFTKVFKVPGIFSPERIKTLIKKIDSLEKEAVSLEMKIERLLERRALLAVDLEDMMAENRKMIGRDI